MPSESVMKMKRRGEKENSCDGSRYKIRRERASNKQVSHQQQTTTRLLPNRLKRLGVRTREQVKPNTRGARCKESKLSSPVLLTMDEKDWKAGSAEHPRLDRCKLIRRTNRRRTRRTTALEYPTRTFERRKDRIKVAWVTMHQEAIEIQLACSTFIMLLQPFVRRWTERGFLKVLA